MRAKHRALFGVCIGVLSGFVLSVLTGLLQLTTWPFESVLIGLGAGLGGRIGRAFGTPNQVRIAVFASLGAFLGLHYMAYVLNHNKQQTFLDLYEAGLNGIVLSFVCFIVGLLVGIRIWLGGDVGETLTEYNSLDLE